ncbi:hypothetical protein CFC21_109554 [Triticum aestivum]|uniref:Uncharacterized protein n=2 Tax=Triticum aestivum TaxID=4565 RepID=A0A3B6TSA3_WHEAT|nr:uncharacterized protein LOC123164499 [Triticum aestivum]KAF7109260.1 hypothetical protein CFC21_109554 [Triticum aestivum]
MTAPEILEVRCAGCGETLEVEQGMTEFACPGCAMPQALPPELMPHPPPRPRRALPLHHGGGARDQMPCGGCGAVLAVPRGLRRITCPLCASDLVVDGDPLRLHQAGVQVISPAAVASIAPTSLRRSEEEPRSQAIHVGQVQVGRYNKPIHFEQEREPSFDRSVHEESSNSPRSNPKIAVHVRCAEDAPVDQLFHRDESHIKLPNGTVPRHGFKKKGDLSASPGSICAERIVLDHPSKVSNALRSQGGPSIHSFHTEEVHGQHQSNIIGNHENQKARHASVASIVEQEIVKPPSHTASGKQVHTESHGNTTVRNQKRQRSSWTTGGKRKKKHMGSGKELHPKCNKYSAAQPEYTPNSNTVQEPVSSPDENQFNPADVDRIIANLYPTSLSQKQAPRAGSHELDNIDATLPPVSRDHGISPVNNVSRCHCQCSADAMGALANRSFNSEQEHEIPQGSSNGICPHGKNGAQGQQVQDDSHPVQVEVECHHNKAAGQHKSVAKGRVHSPNERDYIENRSRTGILQQVAVATACCHPTPSPRLTATRLPSTTVTSVTRSSVHRSPPYCEPPETIHSQDAHAPGIGYMKSKVRKGRGPAKLTEPRRVADRPMLTPTNVDTWDIDPPCPKVASTITLLLKQWHPGSTYVMACQQTNEVHPEQLVLHFHQYHSDRRAIILDEFLRRYKWASGREAECLKLFNRRTTRQFTGLLCDEKRKARVKLFASRKVKGASDATKSNGQSNLDDKGASKKSKLPRRDPAGVGHEDDDPLQWKQFPPEWMLPKWWEMLCEHWASEENLQFSALMRKNRFTGGSARHTAGSRSITMHRKLMMIENGGKPVSEVELFNKTHKHGGGKGEFVTEKARRTVEAFQRRLEEAGDTELDPHVVWSEEVGGRHRGRYYGLPGIIDKARIGHLSKSIPSSPGRKRRQLFTQDQVQEMINHATRQMNETWENRFQSLEKSMRGMVSADISQHASAAGPGAEDDEASHEHTWDSTDDGTYQSAEDDSGGAQW